MDKKIKILIINTEFLRGGAAKIARTLYHGLNKEEKIECYFAYGRGEKIKDKKTMKFSYSPEVYLQGLLNRILGLQGYGSFFSTKNLERFIAEHKFDSIHLHNIHGYYLDLSFIEFLKIIKTPVVWTLHDMWPITGRCAYPFICKKWINGCEYCEVLKAYPKTYIDTTNFMWKKKKNTFSTGWNPLIVPPSRWLAERVQKSYLKEFQIMVIPNGIDTDIFKPKNKRVVREKYCIPNDKKIVLYAAADLKDKRKGVEYFLDSLKYINTKDCMVLTLGKETTDRRLQDTGIEIKQMGFFQSENKISDIYNIADVYCITSLDDNFPTTVLEAMACGIPVVGFRVGGIPEQVTDDCGIMVEPKDTKSLGRALNELLKNDELRNELGKNCRQRVLENYTIDKFVDSYINIYNEVLRRVNL